MHHYASLEGLIHQAIEVEQQLKRKQIYKKERGSSFKSHEKGAAFGKNNSNSTVSSSKACSIIC